MKRIVIYSVVLLNLIFSIAVFGSEEQVLKDTDTVKLSNIAFKQDSTVVEYGITGKYIALLLILASVILGLWWFRDRLFSKHELRSDNEEFRIINQFRINFNTQAYLLKVHNDQFLMIESKSGIALEKLNFNDQSIIDQVEE